jgi:predicted  nucleic acid-binding Zn-ribbon protein
MFDAGAPPQFDPQLKAMGDLGRKVRTVEDRINELTERMSFTSDSLNKKEKEMEDAIATMLRTVSSLQKDVTVLKTELGQMRKEIQKAAPSDKVAELEGYINMIDPMKFVTRDEVKKLIAQEGRK